MCFLLLDLQDFFIASWVLLAAVMFGSFLLRIMGGDTTYLHLWSLSYRIWNMSTLLLGYTGSAALHAYSKHLHSEASPLSLASLVTVVCAPKSPQGKPLKS